MSNNNPCDEHDEDGRSSREHPEEIEEISSSLGSHSNSTSSSRRPRIVELLHSHLSRESRDAEQNGSHDWVIGDEFYDEDVADESDNLSGDGDDEIADDDVHEGETDEEGGELEHEDDPDINGFVAIDREDYDDDSITESEEDDDENGTENYDTLLPASHSYLGPDLRESSGRLVLTENEITSLLLINFRHIVLFPGQTLPITTANLNPGVQHCLSECVRTGPKTIGLMSDPSVNPIGTTAEIRNYSTHEPGGLKLILEGRQRFRLIGEPFEITKTTEVKILPEVILGAPYPRISSLLRFYRQGDTPSKFIISKHPQWLLKSYEARNVMKRILAEIKDWCSADLMKDPNDFSYWVAANLPISNAERMQALSFTCAEARLLWLLDVLKKSSHFACATCNAVICDKSLVFSMSHSGPQSSFVNPGGFIHDTITVRKAEGLMQAYNWSDQFTWFPGYLWRMAHCARCYHHIGWCYKSMRAETKPRRFFGLSRVNVSIQ